MSRNLIIHIEHLDPASGRPISRDELLTAPQAVALAKILSAVLPELRQVSHPEIQYLVSCFQDYLRVDGDLHEREFAAFYDETLAALDAAPVSASASLAPADASTLDPEARVFLGRLLLSRETVTPALAGQLAPVFGLLCGLFSQYETQARQEQPALIAPLRFAYRTMRAIALACDRAQERSLWLRLDPAPSSDSNSASGGE